MSKPKLPLELNFLFTRLCSLPVLVPVGSRLTYEKEASVLTVLTNCRAMKRLNDCWISSLCICKRRIMKIFLFFHLTPYSSTCTAYTADSHTFAWEGKKKKSEM